MYIACRLGPGATHIQQISGDLAQYAFGHVTTAGIASAEVEVAAKPLVSLRAILKTLEIGLQFGGRFGGKTINHPGAVPRAVDEAVLSQVSEVLRNLGLRKSKDFLKMANA
jgi:hypothetical protein